MKKIEKFSPSSRLAIKITLILIVSFMAIMSLLLFAQYWIFLNNSFQDFKSKSKIFIDNLRKSHILDHKNFEQIIEHDNEKKYIFTSFNSSGNAIADAIIYSKKSQKIIVNEYVFISEAFEKVILSLKNEEPIQIFFNHSPYFFYRYETPDYIVFYSYVSLNFFEYYDGLISQWKIIFLPLIAIFASMAFYFFTLIIKPIQEQNISLALYNKNLAHELKTPLSVMRSNLEMLELTKNEKFIHSSIEEMTHIENIIDSLLFLIQNNHKNTDFTTQNICQNIEKIAKKFEKLDIIFDKKNRKIFQEIDEKLFKILIENIFENAIKYGKNEKIFIKIIDKEMSFENEIDTIISKKELKNIEEIFYQIDVSRNSEGYGLGIPIMKKIAETFGWKISFYSKNKKFWVKIIF